MTAQPDTSGPDTGTYEVIHLGGQAAVVAGLLEEEPRAGEESHYRL